MFEGLGWEAWVKLGVILAMLFALVRGIGRPEIILFASLGPLLVLGILTPEQAFAGLSNSALLAVAVAASASFLSPVGYQTNMMAMAAGGYKFTDFFRVGLIVNIVVGVATLAMISVLWL